MVKIPPTLSNPAQDQLHIVTVALEPPMQVVGVDSRWEGRRSVVGEDRRRERGARGGREYSIRAATSSQRGKMASADECFACLAALLEEWQAEAIARAWVTQSRRCKWWV